MIHIVHLPCFTYRLAEKFPDHYRLTDSFYAINHDLGETEDLVNAIGLHFESGARIFAILPADMAYRLDDENADAFEAWRQEREPDAEET